MVRNLKDTLVSLHNFRGAAIDSMLENDLGPELFERFVDVDGCRNAMGSAFLWVRRNAKAVRDIGLGQALVVYYKRLVRNFAGEVRAVNNFLGLALLTDVRVRLIKGACGLGRMRDNASFWTWDNCCKRGVGGVEGRRGAERQGALVKVQRRLRSGAGGWRLRNSTRAVGVEAFNICST